ncbi:protein sorting system archaetidylserine synthase [Halobaculum sp. MBLA0143]|uniref:protein sorting system archaetidylserine synthase n=1 Tax=Halobaculum sp. MBLA0143 TaxID=3079933 RepID=UPI003524A25B
MSRPRFLSRLGLADAVTVTNAVVGLLAAVAATVDTAVAARLVLLAAVADGLDGVLARKFGGTAVGPHLDSLADVASFGVAPALLVVAVALPASPAASPGAAAPVLVVAAAYVAFAVVRLAVYTVEDESAATTHGVQTTLSATVVAATVLAGVAGPTVLLAAAAVLAPAMVTPIAYPDLHAQDALVMGVVQAVAVLAGGRVGETFAFALLFLAVGYAVLGPAFYWRETDDGPVAADETDVQ